MIGYASIHTRSQTMRAKPAGPTTITVDLKEQLVRIDALTLRGKWVDFYALLASKRLELATTEQFVPAEQLLEIGLWQNKTLLTLRKEVWAHIENLRRRNLSHVILSRGKTLAWRLAVPISSVSLSPDLRTLERWIEERAFREVSEAAAATVPLLVEAHATAHHGARAKARAILARIPAGRDPALNAWFSLVEARTAPDGEEGETTLDRLHHDWSALPGALARSIAWRTLTIAEYRRRWEDADSTRRTLRRLASDIERHGDVGALAMVCNVLGMLARKVGSYREAESQHLRAVVLSAVNEDFHTLQGALFNVAHARHDRLRTEGRPNDSVVYAYVDACLAVCDHFRVGADEVEAEVSAASWAANDGRIALARAYLERAAGLIPRIDSKYEHACFYAARAVVSLADGVSRRAVIEDFRLAQRLFDEVGPEDKAAWCREHIRTLLAAEPT